MLLVGGQPRCREIILLVGVDDGLEHRIDLRPALGSRRATDELHRTGEHEVNEGVDAPRNVVLDHALACVAFIDGREIDLGSRHKALYEKYREKYRQLGVVE